MWLLWLACNPDPGKGDEIVDFRAGTDGATSGERGNIEITEVGWAGSSDGDTYDPADVFVEFRNVGSLPVNMSGWRVEIGGAETLDVILPQSDVVLGVGERKFAAAKSTGCFADADWVAPLLAFPEDGDAIYVKLTDADERLIDNAGDRNMPAFAGGFDGVRVRSMERVELMFGGEATEPQIWHYYTPAEVDIPNNDRVAERCRSHTLASPGRANSPDYSGSIASGSLD
jgi:hypothetical protein